MADQDIVCEVEIPETEVDQFGTMYEVVEEVVCETEDSQDLLLADQEIMLHSDVDLHHSEEVLDNSGTLFDPSAPLSIFNKAFELVNFRIKVLPSNVGGPVFFQGMIGAQNAKETLSSR